MNVTEAEIKAKELASKGKADFFIRDTLIKNGADPEDVKVIMQKFLDEKNKRSFRDKMIGLIGIVGGIAWIWASFKFDFLRELFWDHETRKIGGIERNIIIVGPFALGVLMLIKGIFKLKKLI